MRLQHLLIVMSLLVGSVVFADEALPENCTILPLSQGPRLTNQCSRPSPTDVTSYWTPSVAQAIAIEKLLPKMTPPSGEGIDVPGSCRQYIGIIVHGKKLIYLNAFPVEEIKRPDFRDWKIKAIRICDGGSHYWGVEFDPADNTFHHLGTNGWA